MEQRLGMIGWEVRVILALSAFSLWHLNATPVTTPIVFLAVTGILSMAAPALREPLNAAFQIKTTNDNNNDNG